ncbi:MDIS1-interacting receptor like kinase 2-like [Daucus carota subsp. sativus]|uniref:MDIS1-interacting receptor like kinase 2-like n=1 Tax=Daucus carota subsp. sativus TaxID=79200 RepID=UPI0007EF3E1E|nr:PREDICTED: MDIS1-interacting receptor like kinase 2-like [Daucus carota subsp. sativus]
MLWGNNLSGKLPSSLGNLTNLNLLDISYNHLSATLPSSLSNITNLERLDVSHNNLSGRLPSLLGNLTNLERLDVSQNHLTGFIPSKLGNLGTGGYGKVYGARLPNEKTFALKKLHRLEAEDPNFDRSFRNEVRVLSNIRHKNIVKLYDFCLHNRCMFLVYEYMENGSLFCALKDDAHAVELDWSKRVSIVKGFAHALSYMHHDCTPPIVHRDISSSNILLNSKMEAFVADFGASRACIHYSITKTDNVQKHDRDPNTSKQNP